MRTYFSTVTDDTGIRYAVRTTLVLGLALVLLAVSPIGIAGTFTFDFNKDVNDPTQVLGRVGQNCGRFGNTECDVDGNSNTDGNASNSENNTDWVQEMVTIGGVRYWHTIVGDPLAGFAQDVYIREGTITPDFYTGDIIDGNTSVKVSDGGGFMGSSFSDTLSSSSLQTCWRMAGFACNPLGHNPKIEANGHVNPTKVAMKQLTYDSEMSFDFEKSEIAEKPNMDQIVSNTEVTIEWKADMSNGNYSAMGSPLATSSDVTAPDVFVNRLIHADGNPPAPPGQESLPGPYDFDYTQDTQNSVLTAGQFTFTPGLGWASTRPNVTYRGTVTNFNTWGIGNYKIYDKGTYSYIGGIGVNLDLIDWKKFMDPDQNPCGGDLWCGSATVPNSMPQ